jgi:hypothetical protein
MRRTLTVLTTLALSLAIAPLPPAQADEVVEVVKPSPGDEGLWDLSWVGCSDPLTRPTDNIYLKIEPSADTPPTGSHNWGVQSEGLAAVGPMAFTLDPTTSVWDLRVDPRNGGTTGWAVAYYWSATMPVEQYWFGFAPLTVGSPGWQTVDLALQALQWRLIEFDPQGIPTVLDTAPASAVGPFATTHGGDGTWEAGGGAYLGYALGCDSSAGAIEPWYFDGLRIGAPGDVTTYDFEELATGALISASRTKVTKGGKVTLKGRPDPTVSGWTELEMILQAKPKGAARFRKVGTATYRQVDFVDKPARLTVRPKKTTKYRWVIEPGSMHSGSTSKALTVKVVNGRPVVTAGTGWRGAAQRPGTFARSSIPRLAAPLLVGR